MPPRLTLTLILLLLIWPAEVSAQMDRHPELKSRAVAWTAFDGSYLIDTSSRAEMLDFFWTVFNQPYGDHGWTGSVNPAVAGATSERWRLREYAQLNAYRALNGSPAITEDATKLDYVQAAALVFAQNPDRPVEHIIDSSWVGYNPLAADAALHSLLNGSGDDTDLTPVVNLSGSADRFIADTQQQNMSAVGHRMYLLHDNSTVGTLGSAQVFPFPTTTFANVWNTPFARQTADPAHFIAYPSPGFFPLALCYDGKNFSWSFVPASDWTAFNVASYGNFYSRDLGVPSKDSTVTAKINGFAVEVSSLMRNNPPNPLTWNFGSALDFAHDKVADGTTVEIKVHDVAILMPGEFHVTGYRDYTYTVTLFDPNKIIVVGYSPKTPLSNISTRTVIGTGDKQMIAGFTVAGATPVRVAVRTQGPGLKQYGIQNAAQSTHIRVYDEHQNLMGENRGWKSHPNWRLLQSLAVAPSQDAEAGVVLTLWPGSYTAVVNDDTGANGIGIVEAFNIDTLSESKLVNLSTRGPIGAGENQMIAGFTIRGASRTVVIRTQGPGLAKYGVSNVVTDTLLTIVDQIDGHTLASNDDWQAESRNARLSSDLTTFAPTDPREAALVLELPPGSYTALVSAKGPPGVGIVEGFDVTP